jgi:predicted CopG family antitoxin
MSNLVTVKLRREVVEALKALGKKGETYSDVIERLLKGIEGSDEHKSAGGE